MPTLEGDSGGDDNLQESGPVILMVAQVELLVAFSGHKGTMTTLLDSGCTRCLVSPSIVEKLGMCLRTPIAFFQLDGTQVGAASTTFVTEPVTEQ